MNKATRHRINAVICLLVLAHAIYWYLSGHLEFATPLRKGLLVAQALLGLGGAVWFWNRSRGVSF
jgi:hypothetical protein